MGSIVLLYWLSRAIFDSSAVALVSALFLAVIPMNVVGSRYFKEDIPLMFFMNLSMFLMVLLIEKRKGIFYLLAGTAIGLSVAVKYAALNLVPFYLAAHCLVLWRGPSKGMFRRLVDWRFLLGLVLVVAAFLAFNTHVISDWDGVLAGFRTQLGYAGRGHHDGTVISGGEHWWTFYLRYALLPGVGLLAALAAAGGVVTACRRRMVAAMFMAGWMAAFCLGLEQSPAKPFPFFARYMHGVAPGLCMFAAFALCEAYRASAGRRWLRCGAVSALALTLLLPLVKTGLINHSIGPGRETRARARVWMEENLEPGSKILVDSRSYGAEPPVDRFDVRHDFHRNLDYVRNRNVDYIVLGSFSYDRFEYDRAPGAKAQQKYGYYLSIFGECELVREFNPRFAFLSYGFHNPVVQVYKVTRDVP